MSSAEQRENEREQSPLLARRQNSISSPTILNSKTKRNSKSIERVPHIHGLFSAHGYSPDAKNGKRVFSMKVDDGQHDRIVSNILQEDGSVDHGGVTQNVPIHSFYNALKDPLNISLRMLAFIFCSEVIVFTVQIWVTLHANSMAVFTDMVYGAFDVLSAAATFIFEFLKMADVGDRNNNRIMDDVGSSISLGVLFLSTLTLLWQAACSLVLPHLHMMDVHGAAHDIPDREVPNGNLVLFLVVVSLVNDIVILFTAWRMNLLSSDGGGRNMNAVAAIMHVVADLLRSFCVLADGLIIKYLDRMYMEDGEGRVHAKEEEVQVDIC